MVGGGVGWWGVVGGGVGWWGVVWGDGGWCGMVWGGVGFVPVVVWVLNVFGRLLRPGLSGCLVGGREKLDSSPARLQLHNTTFATSVESTRLVAMGRLAE